MKIIANNPILRMAWEYILKNIPEIAIQIERNIGSVSSISTNHNEWWYMISKNFDSPVELLIADKVTNIDDLVNIIIYTNVLLKNMNAIMSMRKICLRKDSLTKEEFEASTSEIADWYFLSIEGAVSGIMGNCNLNQLN